MSSNPSTSRSSSRRIAMEPLQPAIWASRHVEWPLASKLPGSTYAKLLKSCRVSGQQIGVLPRSTGAGVGPRIGPIAKPTTSAEETIAASKAGATSDVGTSESSTSNYFTDLMSRISASNTAVVGSQSGSSTQQQQALLEELLAAETRALSHPDAAQIIRPPRCVFVANGWIVAALECSVVSSITSSSHHHHSVASASLLRLISRWNVRRGVASNLLDGLVALPPPVCIASSILGADYRVAHIFVDPTGSHILISSYNGEVYYIHSNNSSRVIKLAGFGCAADGTWSVNPPNGGIPATATIHATSSSSSSTATTPSSTATSTTTANAIQTGITLHSYVTAVAWDKEKGTEGTTQTILLGTSIGEIYEYKLVEETMAKGGEHVPPPVLLHRLDTAGDGGGGRVSGLHFERLRTGVLVLAATSGTYKRTRLYTFYSPHSSSFRYVLSDSVANLQELPGSVDWAHLCLCSDHFAMRTRTGIYYGTIDRSLSGPAILSGGSSLMISDSGLLHYSDGNENETNIPVSMALTPHHIVTLSENNEVKFINRVAQKVIQTERIVDDARNNSMISGSGSSGGSLTAAHLDEIQHGELLMDIRRPDQIWLRRGRSLVHISSSQEDRDVWKFTLQKCLAPRLSSSGSRPNTPAATAESKRQHHKSSSWSSPFATALTEEEKAQEALFEQAKTLCTNASQKAVVTAVRAEYHLQHGRGELAAKYLAQCPPSLEPFADTAIRLALPKLGIDDITTGKARECLERSNLPLITYLSDKMRMGSSNDDKMTCTMIGAWLIELFLNERSDQLTCADDPKGARELETSHRALLGQFLSSNVNNMDAKSIIKILTSHDVGAAECASYAARSGDIATAVNAALSAGVNDSSGAHNALRILNEAPFELAEPLYYKYAVTLLSRIPNEAGESFLNRFSHGLSPMRLLPSIMIYEKTRVERSRIRKAYESSQTKGGVEESKSDQVDGKVLGNSSSFNDDSGVVMNYLEGVIKQGCRNSAVFNYLLSLYAKLDDEDPLFEFLSTHIPVTSSLAEATRYAALAGDRPRMQMDDLSSTPLDMSYALRAVLSTGRHFRSAIKLYMGFGMRQQAVELALKVDPALARKLAQGSQGKERKRLWLMIAKAAATDGSVRGGKDVVSRVISVLKDCGPDVLSIEDVLPFLPDFGKIDDIKQEICEALTSYSSKIDSYLNEMNECDQLCANVREEISRLRSYHMRVKADARCAFTNKRVLEAGEPFYAFPSGFVFLASALKKEVLPYLSDAQRERVEELESLLKTCNDESKQSVQAEFDGLIAAECPLTGSVMVESIDRGFVTDDDEFHDGKESMVERVDV